ncbi:MAG TPA: Hsp20/alpha crystallin family protein [Candidatus Polarisedimenticolia bacterium]|nr:Hsp20/alpha crystallin family protein [Candidatus Polarisedimenticolia bacterium]
MNRLLENVLVRGELPRGDIAGWSPAVDLREDREGYHVSVELPGVHQEEIRARLEGGRLLLEGERRMEKEARSADHLRVERSYGPFSRAVLLPGPVDERRISARFDLGVLQVFLPRSAEARSRPTTIPIS